LISGEWSPRLSVGEVDGVKTIVRADSAALLADGIEDQLDGAEAGGHHFSQ